VIEPGPIEKFQDILVQGDVLRPPSASNQDLILTEYASKAK
jgi:hypothetical protein